MALTPAAGPSSTSLAVANTGSTQRTATPATPNNPNGPQSKNTSSEVDKMASRMSRPRSLVMAQNTVAPRPPPPAGRAREGVTGYSKSPAVVDPADSGLKIGDKAMLQFSRPADVDGADPKGNPMGVTAK